MKTDQFKVLLYLKKGSPDKSGKVPVMGRITVGRTMAQLSLKLSCDASLWDARASRLAGKSSEAVRINSKLDSLLLGIHAAYQTLSGRKQPFDATAVKELFQGGMESRMTLLQLFDRVNEELRPRAGIDFTQATMRRYLHIRKVLAEFIRKRFNTADVAFGQFDEPFIREFHDFLIQDKHLSTSSVCHYLALVKKICRIAYQEGYADKHYFARYPLPKVKESTPKALSRSDFEKIRDLEIPAERHTQLLVRDMFLFACYTGVAYADVVSVTKENLVKDDRGNLWLKYHRRKNGQLAQIKLLPEAIGLTGKYHDEGRQTIFPVEPYAVVRRNIQSLGILAGIQEGLGFHQGRHSFASLITLEQGVPIETVSKMLGHSDITTTQIYARVTPEKLFEDMDTYIEATRDLVFIV